MSWRDRKKQFQQQVANFLDLPSDLMMDLPKITLVGDLQVIVENHRGIMVYTTELVKVNTNIGELSVTGRGLTLRNILPDEIMVEGKITGVYYGKQGEA